ncbi:MAG: hypothetical protein ABJ004_06335 [Cyclobacteriaceae bacterium]
MTLQEAIELVLKEVNAGLTAREIDDSINAMKSYIGGDNMLG